MANARQVARWIVDDICYDLHLHGHECPPIGTVLRWLDIAEAGAKKYSSEDDEDMRALHHVNGNVCDNRPENLRVVTVSENMPVPVPVPVKKSRRIGKTI